MYKSGVNTYCVGDFTDLYLQLTMPGKFIELSYNNLRLCNCEFCVWVQDNK